MASPSPNGVLDDAETLVREFLLTTRRGLLQIVSFIDRCYPRPQPPERCPRCDWRLRD